MNRLEFELRCAAMRKKAARISRPRPVRPAGLCACGWCAKCVSNARKQKSRGAAVTQDWRQWPESYRWLHFRSVARDMFGPDANLQSSLHGGWLTRERNVAALPVVVRG